MVLPAILEILESVVITGSHEIGKGFFRGAEFRAGRIVSSENFAMTSIS